MPLAFLLIYSPIIQLFPVTTQENEEVKRTVKVDNAESQKHYY